MGRSPFATFLIICPTSFFLGIIFNNWHYDTHTLWTAVPPSDALLHTIEAHYSTLSQSPSVVARILHCVVITGICGFLLKLWKPSESNMLFDGASLVLYMIGFIMYGTNVIRGLRTVETGSYSEEVGRVDTLRVLAATQVIMALVFVGVLVLQSGQWYAEDKEEREIEALRREEEEAARKAAAQVEGEAVASGSKVGGKGAKKRN